MKVRRLMRAMLAVSLMGVNVALPRPAWGWGFVSACDPAVPDPGGDQVFTNLRPFEVDALYRTLRQMKSYYDYHHLQRPITDTLASSGQSMQTKNYVHTCTDLGAASSWSNSWICIADLTATFKLSNRWQDKLKGAGGGVTFINDATGTALELTERVTYSWDASTHWLTAYIRYPASVYPEVVNHQRLWGSYTMTAFSSTRVHSSSQQSSGGLSISNPISLFAGAQKTDLTSYSFVRADINGNPYWADTGLFQYIRDEGVNSHFAIGMNRLTDSDAHLETRVNRNVAVCGDINQFQFDLKVNGNGLSNTNLSPGQAVGPWIGSAIQVGNSSATSCHASSEPFVSHLDFRAQNATWSGIDFPVGQELSANIYAINQGGGSSCTCKQWYEVAFDAKVSWYLHFDAGSNEAAAFDLSGGSANGVPAKHYETTFACACV